jgi:hypothetical protein
MHANSVLLIQDGTNMAMRPKKEEYGSYGFGDSGYLIKNGKEYLDVKRKTMVPGLKRLTGKPYEVPKGTMKTAKAERGKTAARVTNVAKRAEVAAAKKVAIKKLAKNTAQAERGKTVARKTSVAKRQTAAKEAAKKPKRLY